MRVILSKIIGGKKILLVLLLILSLFITTLPGCMGGVPTKGWSGVISGNGTLYLGGMDGSLYAVNPANGTIIWSKELEPLPSGGWFSPSSFAAIYSTPAFAGRRVFAGSYLLTGSDEHGRIFGLNAENGEIAWIFPPRGSLAATIIGGLTAAGGLVYAGATDHKLYALDEATGDKKWEFTAGDQIWASPVVSGNTIYIGSFDRRLYALDAATGTKKWEYETDGAIVGAALPFNNTVYIGSYNRHFYALDAASGTLKWDFTADRGFWATPAAAGNAVFVPCLDGKVYILDAGSGRELGTVGLSQYLSSSPTTLGDAAVVASPEGNLYLLSAANFNIPPFSELKSTVFAPLASADGTIYIHTWSPERLYALDAAGKQKWNPLELQKK